MLIGYDFKLNFSHFETCREAEKKLQPQTRKKKEKKITKLGKGFTPDFLWNKFTAKQ